jgi:uncharacterized protein YidB (DUF937 family)
VLNRIGASLDLQEYTMGLLDGLLGSLATGGAAQGGGAAGSAFGGGGGAQAELLRIVLSMLAGGGRSGGGGLGANMGGGLDGMLGQVLGSAFGGGAGGLGGAPAAGAPGGLGGLGDLMARFQQAGMGDTMNSWIGSGPNAPIEPGQLSSVLGADTIGQIASQVGLSPQDTAGHLSQMLPEVLDRLTPKGQVPEGGLGGIEDLLGMLMKR